MFVHCLCLLFYYHHTGPETLLSCSCTWTNPWCEIPLPTRSSGRCWYCLSITAASLFLYLDIVLIYEMKHLVKRKTQPRIPVLSFFCVRLNRSDFFPYKHLMLRNRFMLQCEPGNIHLGTLADAVFLYECAGSHHGTGQAGWGPARWLTEPAAEAPAPDPPSNVLHANRPRCCRLLCESPPGEQRGKAWGRVSTNSCSDSVYSQNCKTKHLPVSKSRCNLSIGLLWCSPGSFVECLNFCHFCGGFLYQQGFDLMSLLNLKEFDLDYKQWYIDICHFN